MQKKMRIRVVSLLLCCMTVLAVMTAALMIRPNSTPYLPADPTIEGLTFTDNGQGYTVTNYVGSSRDVLIPSEYEGKAVTVFSSKAFANVERDWGDGPVQLPNDWFDDSLGQIEVDTVTIRNKKIVFDESANTIPDGITIYGYEGSTAQAYAEKYGKEFVAIPEIRSAYITLGSDITVYYKVVLPEAFRGAQMHFAANSREALVTPVASSVPGEYLFAFEGLTPQMIGENIRAELVLNGQTLSSKDTYSVLQYCQNIKEDIASRTLNGYSDEQYAALDTLIADLLEYGARAQLYVNYKTDKLVNVGITGQSTFTAIPDTFALKKPTTTTAEDRTRLIGAYAKLDNLIRLNFIVATTDLSRVTLKIDDRSFTAEDFEPYADASVYGIPAYVLSAPAVAATNLETVSMISLCIDDVACQSMEYGVITYLHSKQNDADAKLQALVRSIRNYGLSAVAYKNAMALQVVKNGTSSYRVVYSASASQTVIDAVNELIAGVKTTTGVTLTAVTDAAAPDSGSKEILVGSTNRSVSTQVGAGRYAIATEGGYVVLTGATNDAVAFAVREFLRLYAGYTSPELYEQKSDILLAQSLYVTGDASISDRVALFVTDSAPSYVEDLTHALSHVCETLSVYDMDSDLNTVFDIKRNGLVIIAGADRVPSGMKNAVYDYMEQDGRVLTLGGPIFQTEVLKYGDTWMERDEYIDALLSSLTVNETYEVSDDYFTDFKYLISSNVTYTGENPQYVRPSNSGSEATIKIQKSTVPNQSSISKQIYYNISSLSNYNILRFNDVPGETSFNTGTAVNAISLWAKRDTSTVTDSIVVAFSESFTNSAGEADDVSWATVIKLTDDWKHYVLPAALFEVVQDSNTPAEYKGNNANGKSPNMANLTTLSVGFNPDVMGQSSGVANGWYVAGISVGDYNVPEIPEEDGAGLYVEGLMPLSELYPITNGATMLAHDNQVFVNDRSYTFTSETDVFSCYAHREGMGYGNERRCRFVPLLTVHSEDGLRSGYAAWINIFSSRDNTNGGLDGAMLGAFSITSEDFYDASGLAAVVETVEAMMGDAFLIEGGSDEFTYLEGTDTQVVAGAIHSLLRGSSADGISTKISLYAENGKELMSFTRDSANQTVDRTGFFRSTEQAFTLGAEKPTLAVVSLYRDGEEIDRIENDIHYWAPKPVEERSFVYVEDGYFKKDGEIVNIFGVNFGPSYRAGLSAYGWWMGRSDYDPDVIANDLARVKKTGFNAVAVWCSDDTVTQGNTVLDLLRQCEELGLYVDMAMSNNGPSFPLKENFSAEKVKKWIQTLRIHENDTVIAFDIAWEERIGQRDGSWWVGSATDDPYIGSKNWEDDFLAWIDVQYGSLAHAQELWGEELPIASDTGAPYVTPEMMDDTTGKYHKVTAAYYRFLDDIVATELIRKGMPTYDEVAPNQLVSFRMSMSGSACRTNLYKPSTLCFDFMSLAPVFDFLSPEGYALGASGDAALQVAFANAYARYTKPNTPVVWKEFSSDTWSDSEDGNFNPNPNIHQSSAATLDAILGQMYDAYTSALYYWWSASGLRRDENGDCGCWNPDGSDREITKVLREWAPIFKNQGERNMDNVAYITVDRDNQAGVVYGMFEAIKSELSAAVSAGKTIVFKDNNGSTGANNVYADTVLNQAVGGTAATGTYPLRYVNGIVKGVTRTTKNGQNVLLVTVCNTKQTTWRADTVSLVSTAQSAVAVDYTIDQDVAYLEEVTLEIPISNLGKLELRFEISGVEFGPLYSAQIQ